MLAHLPRFVNILRGATAHRSEKEFMEAKFLSDLITQATRHVTSETLLTTAETRVTLSAFICRETRLI
jgi:hypothetical protein